MQPGAAVFFALFLLLVFSAPCVAQNPFFSAPDTDREQQRSVPEQQQPEETPGKDLDERPDPNLLQRLWMDAQRRVVTVQLDLRKRMTAAVRELQASFSPATLFALLLGSFTYGVVHAAGPGHGKAVAAAFTAACSSPLRQGALLGLLIGFFHAASAVVLVTGLHFIVGNSLLLGFEEAGHVAQTASYALIVCIGGYLFVQALRGLFNKESHATSHAHGEQRSGNRGLVSTAFIVGFAPCPGAAVILLFALAESVAWLGFLAVTAMSLGMGLTISAASAATSACRLLLKGSLSGSRRLVSMLEHGVGLMGSAAVLLLGALLLSSSLS